MHTYMHTCIHTYIHAYIHTCMHAYIHINTTKHKVLTMDNPARARMIPSTALRMNFDQSSGILDVSAPGHHTHTHTHTHTYQWLYHHLYCTPLTRQVGQQHTRQQHTQESRQGDLKGCGLTLQQWRQLLHCLTYSSAAQYGAGYVRGARLLITHSPTHSLTEELRGAVEQQQACQP
jgi:hypothetical protein